MEQTQVFEKSVEARRDTVITEDYEEYKYVQIIPPPKDPINTKDLIPISQLPPWAHKAFGSTKHLNTIQTKVFPRAF